MGTRLARLQLIDTRNVSIDIQLVSYANLTSKPLFRSSSTLVDDLHEHVRLQGMQATGTKVLRLAVFASHSGPLFFNFNESHPLSFSHLPPYLSLQFRQPTNLFCLFIFNA